MSAEREMLDCVSAADLASAVGALVRIPSVTGEEEDALRHLDRLAAAWGLESHLREHDLEALRAAEGYPGETAARSKLFGLVVLLPGRDATAPRLCLNGHVDVVPPGKTEWGESPWSGATHGGLIHGRGSVDMKGGVIAVLYALAIAARTGWEPPGDIVVQIVSSEEDGGLGTFAALTEDDDFAAALIPEPTSLNVVCAHAGSLHFKGRIRGRAAHAALRMDGLSAIDRYIPVHEAIRAHERIVNSEIQHPLLQRLELPCPIEVGRLDSGSWAAEVPDLLEFAGRVGFPFGVTASEARSRFEAYLNEALDNDGPPLELDWLSEFAPGETSTQEPFVGLVSSCLSEEQGHAVTEQHAVPWGADMHQYTSRGIPCVMLGPTGIERAHAPLEAVGVDELVQLTRVFLRIYARFGRSDQPAETAGS